MKKNIIESMGNYTSVRTLKRHFKRQNRINKTLSYMLLTNLAVTTILAIRSYNLNDRIDDLGGVIEGLKKGD